ncbi:phage terminase small subunit [Variovorax ureilyticus]|uniref:phage terminase small subunit n=1 Tax=Variovorax ureilyticus TaxID=1836198 RepID=UPI003D6651A3
MRPLSPAQRHRARILQEQAQATSPYGTELQGDAYGLMRIKLSQDKARLSATQSHERRAEMKAKLLPEYLDWIETAVKGTGAQDQVLTTVMVWCFDAGAYGLGLRIASYVIRHKMPMADEYKRSAAAIVIDELANAYLKGQWKPLDVQAGEDDTRQLAPAIVEPGKQRDHTAATLAEAYALTAEQDAPDQARAKLLKAIAYAAMGKVQTAEDPDLTTIEPGELRSALQVLQRALTLDSNCGVKKDIERLERVLAKTGNADASPPTQQPAAAKAAPARKTPAAKKAASPARQRPPRK